MKIYVGWDSREDIAYKVCKHSIITRTDTPVEVVPLMQKNLRKTGIYTRHNDVLSSTEFTFTRFFVPFLNEYKGWALFCDCDFLFQADVAELFAHTEFNDDKAVMVVKHDYIPTEGMKMDGKIQYPYPRKNWSSLILWNCAHPKNNQLTPDVLNRATGAFLHRFSWLDDNEIGELPKEWNWLVNWYHEPEDGTPKAVHYTEGGPWFPNYIRCEYGANWVEEKFAYLNELENDTTQESNPRYENIPEIIKSHLDDVIKYRVDPEGEIYDVTYNKLIENLKEINTQQIVAIESELDQKKLGQKGQSVDPVIQSFVMGCGGQITTWEKTEKSMTPIVLRGITKRKQMTTCRETGRDFYFVDTGYFGNARKKLYHRITKNDMQYLGPIKDRSTDRLEMTNWKFKKFSGGRNILLCPPSAKAMITFGLDLNEWIEETTATIRKYTDRPIVVREKQSRSVRVSTDTMEMALTRDIHCLVTFNSIAAVESIMYGKPAFTLGPNAAQHICHSDLSLIEEPYYPTQDEVHRFFAHLAYCQFTELEMRSGFAWRILNEE